MRAENSRVLFHFHIRNRDVINVTNNAKQSWNKGSLLLVDEDFGIFLKFGDVGKMFSFISLE